MASDRKTTCPDCEPESVSRRGFMLAAGGAALASSLPAFAWTGASAKPVPETNVAELYATLTPEQKKVLCFSFNDPLRQKVSANWKITEPKIGDMSEKQQDLIEGIVRGLTSEEGFEKFQTQMGDDDTGIGAYHIAIFGEPGQSKFEFVLTGRHVTMRADGNSVEGVAFGGPMVYGHAASSFTEKPDHEGNVFWYQAKRANEVFKALDPKQREVALRPLAPKEDRIELRSSGFDGLRVGEMSRDQKELVSKVMGDLLNPYRESDVKEVMDLITANGGIDKIHMAFYKNDETGKGDIGNDGVWDIWRLEGPGFVWHFRGAPHVHTWVNIAKA